MSKVTVIILAAFGLIIGAWVYFPVWFGLEGLETTQQSELTTKQVAAPQSDPIQYAEPKVENWNELKQELVADQNRSAKAKFQQNEKTEGSPRESTRNESKEQNIADRHAGRLAYPTAD